MDTLRKYLLDLKVRSVQHLGSQFVLIKLTSPLPLPPMLPGQFVQVRIDHSPATFLRRPISICLSDPSSNELWLLVAMVGQGTRRLAQLNAGDVVNCLLPLGHGFTLPAGSMPTQRHLLVGGGVGVAPLLFLGKTLSQSGAEPTFLLGARQANGLLLVDEFEKYGRVFVTTEDGSLGERGFVTQHSLLLREQFDLIQTCGPTPMMKAVARYAREHHTECEASLENLMACGLGACLCCVEKTTDGHLCVCKEGPVFNIRRLLWE